MIPPSVDLRRQTWMILILVALSTPLALVAETGLRKIMFPPEFEEVRAFLRPALELPVWSLLGLVVLTTMVGMRWQKSRVETRMATRPREEQTQHYRDKETFDSLVLFTSVPQVPAIIATFGFMFGAPITPVVVNMAAATVGVVLVGVTGLRRAAQSSRDA